MKKSPLIALALLGLCSSVQAQATTWLGFTNDWHDSGNWTGGVPNTATAALFDLPFPESIDLGTTLGTTNACYFDVAPVTFTGGQLECTQSASPGERSFIVAGPPFSQVTVHLVGTQLRSLGVTDIALGIQSVGTLIVDGVGAQIINDNPNPDYWLAVGSAGWGELEIVNGALVDMGVHVTAIGDFFDGSGGSLLVQGSGSKLETRFLSVAKRAPGNLRIENGGAVLVGSYFSASDIVNPSTPGQPAAPASVTVTGMGSLLETGFNGESASIGWFGPATLLVDDGGVFVTGGRLGLGDESGLGLGSCDALLSGPGSLLRSTKVTPGGGVILKSGTSLRVQSGAEVRGDKIVQIKGGARLALQGGTVTGPTIRLLDTESALLTGSGTVNGNLWNGGVVSTEAATDHLFVTGGLLQNSTAVLEFGIHGLGVGIGHGDLSVAGDASITGVLRLRFEGGYLPSVGDMFPVLSAASIFGEFTQLEVINAGGCSFELLQSGGLVSVRCLGEAITSYCECVVAPTCGNASPDSGCLNSTGQGALLSAQGAPALHLAGTSQALAFELTQIPANQFAILFMGPGTATAVLGDGRLCVGTGSVGLFRFDPKQADGSGRVTWDDIPGYVAANFPPEAQFAVGEQWYFQGWHRDPNGPCGTGSNLSQGVAVLFSY